MGNRLDNPSQLKSKQTKEKHRLVSSCLKKLRLQIV